MPRPRILHVGPIPPPIDGGIAAYLEGMLGSSLAERFALMPFDVRVPNSYRRFRSLRPFLSLKFLARLDASLRKVRPDLVHIHSSSYLGFWEKALLARVVRRHRLDCVFHLHGGDFDRFLQELTPRRAGFARRALQAARIVIVPCVGWRPLVEGFAGAGRVEVIPNAIRCDDFAGPAAKRAEGEALRLLFLGFVSPRKGLDELLRAVQALQASGHADFVVDIVGGEEEYGQLQHYMQLYRDAGVAERVHFHGTRLGAEKLDFLHRADIFVLPSRNESFGIANLEAMASGLPVVSTRTGAIPEYLEDGVHGLLVQPGDANALAAALGRLLTDPALRARLGAAARRRARDYDWSVVGSRMATLYAGIAPGKAP